MLGALQADADGLLRRLLARRVERAGIVDLGDLVIAELEHLLLLAKFRTAATNCRIAQRASRSSIASKISRNSAGKR